ncbi:dTDP-4-dehydrorhamnose 3,5-epimerase [Luteimonas sp. FXH3W]|uniref:dTDP-4-dehydrorhamnose 3,5-epimerase n=1 Tax=Aquilutibacter rugosus TaxID=3115820 RepID=A0ABU7UXS4_9GAMM
MNILKTSLDGCLVLEPHVFTDERGWFFESFNLDKTLALGSDVRFRQGNTSSSIRGALRGLHYQWPRPQGKLISVVRGEVWDVAVDIRRGSPQFGQWTAVVLSAENKRQLWIPEGFAHGFVTLSDTAVFTYLCTDTYQPQCDANVAWDDPELAIDWPLKDVLLSPKDAAAPRLVDIAADRLPEYWKR